MDIPNINEKLKAFNKWWDEFILEAIKPAAILSMGLGTVAIFSLQGLAINPWFVLSWAIVQAVSIDGLFFATWDRLFSQKLKRANVLAIIGLSFIGLVLALIAIAINAIIGFQVLWALADSQVAMTRLGISSELFTAIRAVLAVVVFVMMSYVRARARAKEAQEPVTVSQEPAAKPIKRARVVAVSEAEPLALPETTTSHNDGLIEATGANTESNGANQKLDYSQPKPGSKYWLVKEAIAREVANGNNKPNLKAISDETGAGYSTVKLYAPAIKQELQGDN